MSSIEDLALMKECFPAQVTDLIVFSLNSLMTIVYLKAKGVVNCIGNRVRKAVRSCNLSEKKRGLGKKMQSLFEKMRMQ